MPGKDGTGPSGTGTAAGKGRPKEEGCLRKPGKRKSGKIKKEEKQ